MSELGIPRSARLNTLSFTDSEDQKPILELPTCLQGKATCRLAIIHDQYRDKVATLQSQLENCKKAYDGERLKFFQDIKTTYLQFMEALSKKESLRLPIQGSYPESWTGRSVSNWLESNPGKSVVVNEMMDQCKMQGWNPYLEISDHSVDDDGMQYGGDILYFICSFKD